MFTLKKIIIILNKNFPFFSFYLRGVKSYLFGEYELKFLNKLLKNNNKYHFVDIGANTGVYSFIAHKYSAHCFVFEPNPIHLNYWKYLEKKINSITFFDFGLSDKNEKLNIYTPVINKLPIHGLTSTNKKFFQTNKVVTNRIQFNTLDSIHFPFSNKFVVKIDVEGHELKVLKGAFNFIKNSVDVIIIEIEKKHSKLYKKTYEFLASLGFDCFISNSKGFLSSISKITFLNHINESKFSNYVFVKKDIQI